MARKLFIFDCFGVIVSDVSTLFMKNHLNSDEQRYMCQNVFRAVDTGKIKMDEMFAIVAERYNLDINEIKREWKSLEYVLEDTVKVIERLHSKGHCIALLSNADADYVDYLFKKFDIHKHFDYEFVSSKYGYAKPDKEFYKLCVDSFDEQFDAVYFTDDNPVNLQGIAQFGITPVLFTNAREFAEKIKADE